MTTRLGIGTFAAALSLWGALLAGCGGGGGLSAAAVEEAYASAPPACKEIAAELAGQVKAGQIQAAYTTAHKLWKMPSPSQEQREALMTLMGRLTDLGALPPPDANALKKAAARKTQSAPAPAPSANAPAPQ